MLDHIQVWSLLLLDFLFVTVGYDGYSNAATNLADNGMLSTRIRFRLSRVPARVLALDEFMGDGWATEAWTESGLEIAISFLRCFHRSFRSAIALSAKGLAGRPNESPSQQIKPRTWCRERN